VLGRAEYLNVFTVDQLLTFLSPPFGAAYLRAYIMPFAIGEAVLTLWLLVKGVDAERWKASALSSA
jgi:hypothetical protein